MQIFFILATIFHSAHVIVTLYSGGVSVLHSVFPNLVCDLFSAIAQTQSSLLQKNLLSCCFRLLEQRRYCSGQHDLSHQWLCAPFVSAVKYLLLSRNHDLSIGAARLTNLLCTYGEHSVQSLPHLILPAVNSKFIDYLIANNFVGKCACEFVSFAN